MVNLDEEVIQEEQLTTENEPVEVIVEEEQKTEKINKSKTKKTSKAKAAFSELKKVTWPGFGKVLKQTVVVLTVALVFLVIIMGIDYLLSLLNSLLIKNI